ncbi:MAG: hypothetical protein K8H88_05415 [Sandaracinaceae bacterium]|nr:hypothetical protein [Sandaracinaceae bacterium]
MRRIILSRASIAGRLLVGGVLASSALLAGCDERAAPDDHQGVCAQDRGARLSARQVIDPRGRLIETVLRVERAGEVTELRVRGELLTGQGATVEGAAVRTWLAGQGPRLLARFALAQPRFDLAVLTADALLALDDDSQERATEVFERAGVAPASLCAHLAACEGRADDPRS